MHVSSRTLLGNESTVVVEVEVDVILKLKLM